MGIAAFAGGDSPAPENAAANGSGTLGTQHRGALDPKNSYRRVNTVLAIKPAVSVVIPVKNEARNLPIVFGTLPHWVSEVVLVDGRSVDDTVAVARKCDPGVKVVHQTGSGKGDALLAGFAACTGDIIVMIDGDGSTDGAEIIRFVAVLVAGADFAKGSRFSSSAGSDDINLLRKLGNRVLCAMVNLAFGTRYTDLCYGYNAFWSRHLPALGLACDGFEVETLMNIRAARAGLRIQEVPSHEFRRVHGESNLHVIRDGWRILKVIAAEAFRHRWQRRRARSELGAAGAEPPVTAVAVASDASKD